MQMLTIALEIYMSMVRNSVWSFLMLFISEHRTDKCVDHFSFRTCDTRNVKSVVIDA